MKKILLMLFVLAITYQSVAFAAQQPPARYEWIESNDDRGVFFDRQTIKFTKDWNGNVDNSTVDVWLYFACNDSNVNDIIASRIKNNFSIDGWRSLDHYVVHYQFNLKTRKLNDLAEIFYDYNGKVIANHQFPYSSWDEITPDTVGEMWFNYIQDYSKKWSFLLTQRANN